MRAMLTALTLALALPVAGCDKGAEAALRDDAHLRNGLNVCAGMVTDAAVAETFDLDYVDPLTALERR